ncbi:hypothetical protein BREVNS_0020 [Brevinematales bacterium NS]|nr:hypothetical protein [Brevinematales bacterium]QJR20770.1 hypothetical protein BREVNS_0020 [Brevinematales bacterium NS]
MNKWITGSMITFFLVACACSTQPVETSGLVLQPFAPFEVRDDMIPLIQNWGGTTLKIFDPSQDKIAGEISFASRNGGYIIGAAIGNGKIYVINEGNPRYPATEIYVVYPAQGKGKTISMGKTPKGGIIGIHPFSVMYAKKFKRFFIEEAWMGTYMIFDGENDTYLGYIKNEWTKGVLFNVLPFWSWEDEEGIIYGYSINEKKKNYIVKFDVISQEIFPWREIEEGEIAGNRQWYYYLDAWVANLRHSSLVLTSNYLCCAFFGNHYLYIYSRNDKTLLTQVCISNEESYISTPSCAYVLDCYAPSNWIFVGIRTNWQTGQDSAVCHLIDLNTMKDTRVLPYEDRFLVQGSKIYVKWSDRIEVYSITNLDEKIATISF